MERILKRLVVLFSIGIHLPLTISLRDDVPHGLEAGTSSSLHNSSGSNKLLHRRRLSSSINHLFKNNSSSHLPRCNSRGRTLPIPCNPSPQHRLLRFHRRNELFTSLVASAVDPFVSRSTVNVLLVEQSVEVIVGVPTVAITPVLLVMHRRHIPCQRRLQQWRNIMLDVFRMTSNLLPRRVTIVWQSWLHWP